MSEIKNKYQSIIPNSTQIPNILLDLVFPRINPVQRACLEYICRRTFGFHKDEDRITLSQFVKGIKDRSGKIIDYGTGYSRPSIVEALQILVKSGVVQIRRENKQKIYYGLNLKINPDELVNVLNQLTQLTKTGKQSKPKLVNRVNSQNIVKRKSKYSIYVAEPLGEEENKENSIKNEEKEEQKQYKPHKQFIEFWYETCQRVRGVKPLITGKDGKNLKRVLDTGIITENELEQLALYFLAHRSFRKFSPSISTFLSSGIINGLMDRAKNYSDFWKELEEFIFMYLKDRKDGNAVGRKEEIIKKLTELKESLFSYK